MNAKNLYYIAGLLAAAGIGYFWAQSRPQPAPTVIVQAPPPVAAPVAPPVVEEKPAAPPAAETKPQFAPPKSPMKGSVREKKAQPARPAHPIQPQSHPAGDAGPANPEPKEQAVMGPPAPALPPPYSGKAPEATPAIAPAKEPEAPRTVTIPAGTMLTVRLNQRLSTESNHAGDTFTATLDHPLVIDGLVIAERGSRQMGEVVSLERAGRVKGVASMSLALTQLRTSDGQSIRIQTDAFDQQSEGSVKKDVMKAGIAAGIGAAIGAIAGGGKGAAIGAGIGGAAGTGGVLATRGKPVEMNNETRLSFRLTQPVTLTEKLNAQ